MDNATQDSPCWSDITDEFLTAAKCLDPGELIQTDNFSLLEAMSAIELMDPKMDRGLALVNANREILTLEQSVKAGILKINNLEPDELIGIIDDTYCCFASWLDGHSLPMTVMTNLYLLDYERIEDRCLRIFSLAILKIIDFIHTIIEVAQCYEEEDFLILTSFNLASGINEQKLLNTLDDFCANYDKTSSTGSKLMQNDGKNSSGVEDSQNSDRRMPEFDAGRPNQTHVKALQARMRFTHNLYACLYNVKRNIICDLQLDELTDESRAKVIKHVFSSAQLCELHLSLCSEATNCWESSINIGLKSGSLSEADSPIAKGFEPLINYRMFLGAYPKSPPIRDRQSTLFYLKDLIKRMRNCIAIGQSFHHKSLSKSLASLEQFGKRLEPYSCVLTRSLLQSFYLPNKSVNLKIEELIQSLIEYCEPAVSVILNDASSLAELKNFLRTNYNIFMEVPRLYGDNTSRQHDILYRHIQEFKKLQCSALALSTSNNNLAIVSTWMTYHLSKLYVKFVHSSFQLELYSTHEFAYVYWYLYDVLYRHEKDQIELVRALANEDRSKTKKNRKKSKYATELHDRDLVRVDAHRLLSGGLFFLTSGLKNQGMIKQPTMDFTSNEICFEERFGFMTDTPHYWFRIWDETLKESEKPVKLFEKAEDYLSRARQIFEFLEMDDFVKICKVNTVVARILSVSANLLVDKEIEYDFSVNSSFVILKLRDSSTPRSNETCEKV